MYWAGKSRNRLAISIKKKERLTLEIDMLKKLKGIQWNRIRQMMNFESGIKRKELFFLLVTSLRQKLIWVPTNNWTSALRIRRFDALPQSNRDTIEEKAISRFICDTRPAYCEDQRCRVRSAGKPKIGTSCSINKRCWLTKTKRLYKDGPRKWQ